jgi:hypothetical protein
MDPEPKPGVAGVSPERSGTSQPPRRSRRGGRGRRGGRPRAPRPAGQEPLAPSAEATEPIQSGAEPFPAEQETSVPEADELRETPPPPMREPQQPSRPSMREPRETPPPPFREPRPAQPMAVQEAIEEVNHIIEALRGSLNDMEEVLESLELAERQKIADEQEIETLRRGLRQLHRPSDRGQHPPRH